ncbi:orotidine 5'-phosphate decarboxylase / HUMPS family protein [Jeotgalibaca sp. A127]|uniref:orotidine 5'-phosphate decarboxylase / HUMPS family protein n=1 Tax=Jeotgalibaca sp. A127 TaxID=3457324 RepID=UPI003FD66489
MKIQLAIDRVTIEEAKRIIHEAEPYVDIIEIGTSFFKDYGLEALRELRKTTCKPILADIKTIDEAEYEFRQIYKHGADIATVMGASALESIRICQKVAKEYEKEYLIDTLEINDDKMVQLQEFDDAIIGLHLAKDKAGNLQSYLQSFFEKHKFTNCIAVAGGVTLEDLPLLKQAGIATVIVGSSITKSEDIRKSAKQFWESVNK